MLHEQRRGTTKVVACSQRAYHGGVFPGMSLAEAAALPLEGLHLEQHDPEADRLALEQLAIECESFSPLVGLEEGERPESLLLDVTGLGPIFGDERTLAEQVVRSFRMRGMEARVAIAATYGAAWGLAHYAHGLPVVVEDSQTEEALRELPVEALRIVSEETKYSLAELGILKIGDLLALPRSGIASRFEPDLLERLEQALGERAETIAVHRALPEIVEVWRFEHPCEDRRGIEFALTQLNERVTVLLRSRLQGALQLACNLELQDRAPVELRIGFYQATAATEHVRKLLLARLEQTELRGAVTSVRLAVLLSAPLAFQQQELFVDSSQSECRRQVASLVDRLSCRLDRGAVLRARPVADIQPEFAYRYEPLTGNLAKPRGKREQRPPAAPLPRPTMLETTPRPIEVIWSPPDGMPKQMRLQNQLLRIERAWGPERIYTGWWRGRAIHRDYYCVETSGGERFWIFRQLRGGQWFLQGVFD